MQIIYIILGIVGWTAAAVVITLYVVAGVRERRLRGFDVNKDDHVETR